MDKWILPSGFGDSDLEVIIDAMDDDDADEDDEEDEDDADEVEDDTDDDEDDADVNDDEYATDADSEDSFVKEDFVGAVASIWNTAGGRGATTNAGFLTLKPEVGNVEAE